MYDTSMWDEVWQERIRRISLRRMVICLPPLFGSLCTCWRSIQIILEKDSAQKRGLFCALSNTDCATMGGDNKNPGELGAQRNMADLDDIEKARVVYKIPNMERANIHKDLTYKTV